VTVHEVIASNWTEDERAEIVRGLLTLDYPDAGWSILNYLSDMLVANCEIEASRSAHRLGYKTANPWRKNRYGEWVRDLSDGTTAVVGPGTREKVDATLTAAGYRLVPGDDE
jgi:hypothetical protein